jgi:DNA-binding MarR family transcriptional regulator
MDELPLYPVCLSYLISKRERSASSSQELSHIVNPSLVMSLLVHNSGMGMPLRKQTERFLAAWLTVRQVVQASNFNRFHQAGLSATQFMTLNVIPTEGASLSDLARKLNLSPATMNETVNSLEDRGMVRRVPDDSDRRKVRILATSQGKATQNQTSEDFHHTMSDIFTRMTPEGRRSLVLGLEEFASIHANRQSRPTHRDGAAPQE